MTKLPLPAIMFALFLFVGLMIFHDQIAISDITFVCLYFCLFVCLVFGCFCVFVIFVSFFEASKGVAEKIVTKLPLQLSCLLVCLFFVCLFDAFVYLLLLFVCQTPQREWLGFFQIVF